MEFTPEDIKGYRVDHGSFSQYAIMRVEYINDEGMLVGPGIEAKVLHPTCNYILPNDYNLGDKGWDRLFKSNKYRDGYGGNDGAGLKDDQLILFNTYSNYSVWRSVHSHNDFRKYVACIIGITYLDMIYRFGSKTVVDNSLSMSAQPLIEGFHKTGLGPRPDRIETNSRDTNFDYNYYEVLITKDAEEISQNYLHFGHCGFKYEMGRLVQDPPDLESPRWWRQVDRKRLDLSDIVCDNQIELF